MRYLVTVEREPDGRWLADVTDLPGVMCYGASRDEAVRAVEALVLRVLAERVEHGELASGPVSIRIEAEASAE